MATTVVRPDSRGRLQLGKLVDSDSDYHAVRDADGTVTLAPIAHVLSVAAREELLEDPTGFARRLQRAEELRAGAPTVTLDEHLDELDLDD